MSDLDLAAQSNVDVIEQCLADTPEDHAWEVNEERLNIEYGERVATQWAAAGALGGQSLSWFAISSHGLGLTGSDWMQHER
jgi:hypothetical protein